MAWVDAVRHAGHFDAIGDEDAFGRVIAEGEAQSCWMQVDPVGDDAVVAATCCHEACEAGLAVLERRHRVEGVGQGGGADVEGGEAFRVGGGGVAEGDHGRWVVLP